jgi:enoyl-CoA hydratase/carnithine racemase
MLKQEIKGAVAILSIDRPERRNAMSLGLAGAIAKVLDELNKDDNVKAIILRGAEHGFCAGSDLKELSNFTLEQIAEAEREKATVARSINFLDTPVIAAVDGFAMGGGLVYAISCDVVFTARDAVWHLPEVELGWNPGWGVRMLLSRVGPVAARHICWGVDRIDGVEATRLGLADFLADEDAASAALAYAEKLATFPHHAVVATKRLCAPIAGKNGQVLDLMANRLFAESCDHETARASYRRFGVNV